MSWKNMNASCGKVISPLCFTQYPGKQDFLQLPKSDPRAKASVRIESRTNLLFSFEKIGSLHSIALVCGGAISIPVGLGARL